jgi:hypothetical protein
VRSLAGVALRTAVACFAWRCVAFASGSQVVILYEGAPDGVVDRAEMRLAAELRAAGFHVEEHASDDAADARLAVERASEGVTFATVLLRRASDGAFTDVWVADHVTRKTVVRRIGARGVGDPADRALALRVVELMRASLVEGLVMTPSVDDSVAPPPPPPADVAAWTREAVSKPTERHAALFDLSLGIAGAWSDPALGAAVAPELRIAWRPKPAWSVGLLAAGPAFGARVAASEGSATARQELALLEAAVEPWSWGPIVPYAAAGGGVYHVATTGYANPPYASRSGDTWAALIGAGIGARLPLSSTASLVLDARELFALPRPVIAFAGQEVAVSMRPGTLAALLLSVSLR